MASSGDKGNLEKIYKNKINFHRDLLTFAEFFEIMLIEERWF